MDIELFEDFLEKRLGPQENWKPEALAPSKVIEILWVLFDIIRPKFEKIKTISYKKYFEKEADEAIERFCLSLDFSAFEKMSPDAWRVFSERLLQLISNFTAKDILGETHMITLPLGLQKDEKLAALCLALLHKAPLLYPPKKDLFLPDVYAPSLTPQ